MPDVKINQSKLKVLQKRLDALHDEYQTEMKKREALRFAKKRILNDLKDQTNE